jgi:hypothetical protein
MLKVAWAALAALLCAASVQETRLFRSRNHTFELELPADWRQPTPDEVRQLRQVLPKDLHVAEPLSVYFVGSVDRWLKGNFDGTLLQVKEYGEEWPLPDDFAAAIRAMWQDPEVQRTARHELSDIRKVQVGAARHEVIECVRRTVPADGARPFMSLDVYAATGGRQVALGFRAWEEDFDKALPEMRRRAQSLAFALRPKGQPGLSDRLWTPIVTGLLVGALFLWLYHRNRRRV